MLFDHVFAQEMVQNILTTDTTPRKNNEIHIEILNHVFDYIFFHSNHQYNSFHKSQYVCYANHKKNFNQGLSQKQKPRILI